MEYYQSPQLECEIERTESTDRDDFGIQMDFCEKRCNIQHTVTIISRIAMREMLTFVDAAVLVHQSFQLIAILFLFKFIYNKIY